MKKTLFIMSIIFLVLLLAGVVVYELSSPAKRRIAKPEQIQEFSQILSAFDNDNERLIQQANIFDMVAKYQGLCRKPYQLSGFEMKEYDRLASLLIMHGFYSDDLRIIQTEHLNQKQREQFGRILDRVRQKQLAEVSVLKNRLKTLQEFSSSPERIYTLESELDDARTIFPFGEKRRKYDEINKQLIDATNSFKKQATEMGFVNEVLFDSDELRIRSKALLNPVVGKLTSAIEIIEFATLPFSQQLSRLAEMQLKQEELYKQLKNRY
jgi:hypothetical protein